MSTAWYFFTFDPAKAARVFGRATPPQVKRLVTAMTDPDERGDSDDDEAEQITAVTRRAMTAGVSYDGLSAAEAAQLDDVVVTAFHRLGLAKTLAVKAVSPEAVDTRLGDHLAKLALARRPDPLLRLLAGGRRMGQPTPARRCGYLVLTRDEADRMLGEASDLVADPATAWADDEAAAYSRLALLPALAAVGRTDGLALYGHLT